MTAFKYNANEVLEIAREIEKNGVDFYTKAAGIMKTDESRKLMTDLAEMEKVHESTFAAMQHRLTEVEAEDTVYDPHGELFTYMKNLADRFVFDPRQRPENVFAQDVSLKSILEMAIEREKDSIIFYEGIKVMVPEKYGRARVDQVIEQEIGHMVILGKHLAKV